MRVLVIVKANKQSEAGIIPDEGEFAEMGAFNEQLVKAGVMLAAEGLHPSSKGKRVIFSKTKPRVIDGPFAATSELAAGYWLWQVKSMDEAVDWIKRMPVPANMREGDEQIVEIRPIYEMEDLGPGYTAELKAKEVSQRQRAKENAFRP